MAGSPPQGYPPQGGQQQDGQYAPPPGSYPPPTGQPVAPYGVHPNGIPYSDKQRQLTGMLQLVGFLGIGGIGRFYSGQIGLGVAQLVVGWVTCGLGLWWSIIEGILMLVDKDTGNYTDADGRPLRPN